jgi:hypothetical protein
VSIDKRRGDGHNGFMAEVWLHTNRRAILWAMLPPVLLAVMGGILAAGYPHWGAGGRFSGGLLALVGMVAIASLAWQLRQPRLAHADGHLLVYLRRGAPLQVPLGVIECFLLGQATSRLPAAGSRLKTATVLIRLCPRAEEWARGEVDPKLGEWRDSHFVLRGTWCEPLSAQVVRQLNAKLGQAQRVLRAGAPR